jgi:FkbM family methyltransferase
MGFHYFMLHPSTMTTEVKPFNIQITTRFGQMLVNRNDQYIGRCLRLYGVYSWSEITLLEQLINHDSVVIEAGANIGSHTIPLARRIGGNGRLYTFEPQRLVYQTLCANIALNNLSNVYPYWAAVGVKSGETLIPELSPHVRNNFGDVSSSADVGTSVPCMTIDDLKLTRCTLIKADVEGNELAVLKGAENTLEQLRPILYLEADRKEQLPALLNFVFALDYLVYWHIPALITANESLSEVDAATQEKDELFNIVSLNIICLPKEKAIPVTELQQVISADDWPSQF